MRVACHVFFKYFPVQAFSQAPLQGCRCTFIIYTLKTLNHIQLHIHYESDIVLCVKVLKPELVLPLLRDPDVLPRLAPHLVRQTPSCSCFCLLACAPSIVLHRIYTGQHSGS